MPPEHENTSLVSHHKDDPAKVKDGKEIEYDKKTVAGNFETESTQGHCESLNKREEYLLEKALRKILQNKSIGKRTNTLQGKLNSKRLGRFPSNYLFTQKHSPKPETVLYFLVDLSGSMAGPKLNVVSAFVNSLRKTNVKGLRYEIRGFNRKYFVNDQVPFEMDELTNKCMSKNEAAGGNHDQRWLAKITEEITADPTDNKGLIILSDGQPTPEGESEWCDMELKDVVRKTIIENDIPYMSIGIMDGYVEEHYPNSTVVNDTKELVDTLFAQTKALARG